jgi:hypothetical protein
VPQGKYTDTNHSDKDEEYQYRHEIPLPLRPGRYNKRYFERQGASADYTTGR